MERRRQYPIISVQSKANLSDTQKLLEYLHGKMAIRGSLEKRAFEKERGIRDCISVTAPVNCNIFSSYDLKILYPASDSKNIFKTRNIIDCWTDFMVDSEGPYRSEVKLAYADMCEIFSYLTNVLQRPSVMYENISGGMNNHGIDKQSLIKAYETVLPKNLQIRKSVLDTKDIGL